MAPGHSEFNLLKRWFSLSRLNASAVMESATTFRSEKVGATPQRGTFPLVYLISCKYLADLKNFFGSPAIFRVSLPKDCTQPVHEERQVRDSAKLSPEGFDLGVEGFGRGVGGAL